MSDIQDQIQQVWAAEQEILDVIQDVCTRYGLRFTLAYGTLLGAVRHGGFIPWDDDIDLMMPREDYEKLIAIWNSAAPKGYILQNVYTDPDYTNTFTKIRKDHTTFLQDEAERTKRYHKGIFVDIFPGDRVAPGRVSRFLQYAACAVNLLYTRGYTSGSSGLVGIVERCLIRLPKKLHPKLRNWADHFIRRWNHRTDMPYFFPCTIACTRHYYDASLFDNLTAISYCGKHYCCVADADAVLRAEYGDYMQLPPEEERIWKHHPILIDFEHNYEEPGL